jgi:bacteriorhodopsin
VTDLLSIAVFGAVLIWGLRNVDLERLGINIHDANPRVPRAAAAPKTEKDVEAAAASNGVTAPAADATPETTV